MASPDAPKEFIMLGVIHRHPRLEELLFARLEELRPDCITLELSRHGVEYRKTRGEELTWRVRAAVAELRSEGCAVEEAALDEVMAYIALPAEYTVACAYGEERGVSVYPVDMDGPSRSYLEYMEELIARDNLAALLCSPGGENGPREMAEACLFFEKGLKFSPYTGEMRERDRHMREEVASVMESHGCARLLHICGWRHLSDPDGLYAPLHPLKAFIHDKALRV